MHIIVKRTHLNSIVTTTIEDDGGDDNDNIDKDDDSNSHGKLSSSISAQ